MKNAYELLCKMGDAPIQYGLWNIKDQRPLTGKEFQDVNGTAEIDNLCIVMKPEEVWKRKLGTCWDCTLLEYAELKKMGYRSVKGVYYEQTDSTGKVTTTTHSFIVYQENNSKSYWWFEYTWYKYCGLHGPYNKEEEIYDTITNIVKATHPTDKIVYWNKHLDIEALLKMKQIGIMDFVKVANPKSV